MSALTLFVADTGCPECDALRAQMTDELWARVATVHVLDTDNEAGWAEADMRDVFAVPTLAFGNARYHGASAILERLRLPEGDTL